MNLFLKKKPLNKCVNFNMADHDQAYKELAFENTPLQNLRNILFNADASMLMQANLSKPVSATKAPDVDQKFVSKADIRKAIDKVYSVPEKHVSVGFVGRIACELCSPDGNKVNHKFFYTNIYINRINDLTHFNASPQWSAP